jgi:hypothetical protein
MVRVYDDDFDKNRSAATLTLHDHWNTTYTVEIQELMFAGQTIELKGRWVKINAE